jgi:hypothetical protein
MGESAVEILAMAENVMSRATPATVGLWPRAAALLARQALEAALDEYWQRRGLPDLAACGTRQQLICLREYVDAETAGKVYEAWATLSHMCHHHPYDLAPTAGELALAMSVVPSLAGIASAQASGGAT